MAQFAYQVLDIIRGLDALQVKTFDITARFDGRSFIPRAALQKYLTLASIRVLLKHQRIEDDIAENIRDNFIAVFAILIRMNKWDHITYFIQSDEFLDSRLPFYDCGSWHQACRNHFNEFRKTQWEFCAQPLADGTLHNIRLHEDRIIPVTLIRSLKSGPDATVDLLEVHHDYNLLVQKDQHDIPVTSQFVLKTYRKTTADTYDTERTAYRMLQHPDIAGYVPQCYGTWRQKDTHHILLEYIDGDNLAKLFTQPHPADQADRVRFWSSLIDILKPLCRIHEHVDPEDRHKMIQGIHQDIKPDNILWKPKTLSGARYDLDYVLIDFGLTYFNGTNAHKPESKIRDGRGTQMFSAPECFRDEKDLFEEHQPRRAKPSKDIWSLGCVFSLALVWSVLGPNSVSDYQDQLGHATAEIDGLGNTSYRGCFHNGDSVLQEVTDMHEEVKRACERHDPIIQDLVPIVAKMLGPAKSRPKIAKVRESCQKAVIRATAILQRESSPSSTSSYQHWSPRSGVGPYDVKATGYLEPGFGLQYTSPALNQSPQLLFGTGWGSTTTKSALVPNQDKDRSTIPANHEYSYPSGYSNALSTQQDVARTPDHPKSPRLSQKFPAQSGFDRVGGTSPQTEKSRKRTPQPKEQESVTGPKGSLSVITESVSRKASQTKHGRSKHSGKRPRHRTPFLYARIDQVDDWIQRKDQKTARPRPVLEEELANLRYRDHIFLVDNSITMEPYKAQVRCTLASLAYLVKRFDSDGIDLYFTRDSDRVRDKHREKLLSLFDRIKFHGTGSIGTGLGRILTKFTDPSIRPSTRKPNGDWAVSIYVLTDGLWGCEEENLCDIPDVLQKTVNKMPNRVGLGIQFIQFGRNEIGNWRLRELDNNWAKHGLDKDIIDHTYNDGNVYKMLLGSFESSWDNESSPLGPNVFPSFQPG
ncbi:hypothetical protein J1614_006383 [Plenodomus biglobosus]|nr:hypothetical protein J1614_006383 [Plenodomus biglobosus]